MSWFFPCFLVAHRQSGHLVSTIAVPSQCLWSVNCERIEHKKAGQQRDEICYCELIMAFSKGGSKMEAGKQALVVL